MRFASVEASNVKAGNMLSGTSKMGALFGEETKNSNLEETSARFSRRDCNLPCSELKTLEWNNFLLRVIFIYF